MRSWRRVGSRIAALITVSALGASFLSCGGAHPYGRAAPRPLPDPPPATTNPVAVDASPAPPSTLPTIDHGDRSRRAVALTFDSNLTTTMIGELRRRTVASFDNVAVIDELDALHAPATFFLSGKWMEQYPDTTARLANDPLFELGSHSYTHVGFAPRCYHLGQLPVREMAADVDHSEQVLHRFAPAATPYFRFPGGCSSAAARRAIAATGVVVVGYDVASGDAFGRSVGAIVQNTLANVRNGSIVVLHITGGNTAPLTASCVPAIIDGLRAKGFELVRVSDLLRSATRDLRSYRFE